MKSGRCAPGPEFLYWSRIFNAWPFIQQRTVCTVWLPPHKLNQCNVPPVWLPTALWWSANLRTLCKCAVTLCMPSRLDDRCVVPLWAVVDVAMRYWRVCAVSVERWHGCSPQCRPFYGANESSSYTKSTRCVLVATTSDRHALSRMIVGMCVDASPAAEHWCAMSQQGAVCRRARWRCECQAQSLK